MANVLGIMSTVGFVGGLLLLAAAGTLFFILDIRAVRDEMLGRTAERTIAEMRQTTWATRRNRERSARRLTQTMSDSPLGEEGGNLHLRTVATKAAGRLRGTDAVGAAADEAATTLLPDGDETPTTLLADDGDEGMTTLLPDADEAATTLLSDEGARR